MTTVCRKCDATWTGLGVAHCSNCHRTFTTASNFDRHVDRHVNRECCAPETVGLVLNDRGQWQTPAREAVSP